MKHDYQTIIWEGEFLLLGDTIEEVQSQIDWHRGCESDRCLAEIHRGKEVLENCGDYVP